MSAYGINITTLDNKEYSGNGSSHAFARVMQDWCQSLGLNQIASDYAAGRKVVVIDVGAKFVSMSNTLAKIV